MSYLRLIALLFCLSGSFIAASSYATSTESAAATISKSQAASIAQQQVGGKVLKIESSNKQGRAGYRVKLLQDSGHVKQVWVDAENGQIPTTN